VRFAPAVARKAEPLPGFPLPSKQTAFIQNTGSPNSTPFFWCVF
jgi:hypothetical protein